MMKFLSFLQNFMQKYEIDSKIFGKSLKNTIFFGIFLKMTEFWTFVDQDFLITNFHSSKSNFFLVSTHSGLIHSVKNRRSSSFLAFCRTKVQLGPKMAIFEPQPEGSNLDQIQKYFVWCLLEPIPRF
jgi:hypothetical protein